MQRVFAFIGETNFISKVNFVIQKGYLSISVTFELGSECLSRGFNFKKKWVLFRSKTLSTVFLGLRQ